MTALQAVDQPNGASPLETTRLWLSAGLDTADRDALVQACGIVRFVSAGTNLLRLGAPSEALHILVDGWAARYTIMADGSRFIPALALPGDFCDFGALRFDQLDYGVTMLSDGLVIVLPRQRLEALLASNPGIANAFWSLALAENAILTSWAASMGRRSALERLAHRLCELLVRLAAVGRVDAHDYDLPLTQEQIADMVGLTPVHVNRTLQVLRTMKLVTVQHRRAVIHDWAALCALCRFDPGYLHLETIDAAFARELPLSQARGSRRLVQSRRHTPSASFSPVVARR